MTAMTPNTDDVAGLVAKLRDRSQELSGRSIDHGCVDSGLSANLADAAADLLESQAKALREAEALAFQLNSGKELQDLMALNNELQARAAAAEARLKEAEKVIKPFAAQFALIECTSFHGIDDNGTWPVDEDQVVQISHLRAARSFLNSASNKEPR